MRYRILSLTALAAAGLVSMAAPAMADAAPASAAAPLAKAAPVTDTAIAPHTLCPSGWVCVWHGAPRSGGWIGGNARNTCYTPFNNNGNAVSNQTGHSVRVYSATGCGGSYFDLPTGNYSYPTPWTVRSVATH